MVKHVLPGILLSWRTTSTWPIGCASARKRRRAQPVDQARRRIRQVVAAEMIHPLLVGQECRWKKSARSGYITVIRHDRKGLLRATLIYGAGDVRVEDVPDPTMLECVGTKQALEMAFGVARDGGVVSRVGAPQYSEGPIRSTCSCATSRLPAG